MNKTILAYEFYTTPQGEVMLQKTGKPVVELTQENRDFITIFIETLKEFYPAAHEALCDVYTKSKLNRLYFEFLIVRRFIKCNFGEYDNRSDINEHGVFHFEFVSCPMRGECKYDGIICNPEFNSNLSKREKEVMKCYYDEMKNHEIADQLFISIMTVKKHRRNAFAKIGVHNMGDFMAHANKYNLFK